MTRLDPAPPHQPAQRPMAGTAVDTALRPPEADAPSQPPHQRGGTPNGPGAPPSLTPPARRHAAAPPVAAHAPAPASRPPGVTLVELEAALRAPCFGRLVDVSWSELLRSCPSARRRGPRRAAGRLGAGVARARRRSGGRRVGAGQRHGGARVADGARSQLSSAEEAFRVMQAVVAAGTTTITDLLDAEAALTSARMRLVRARYESAVATVALRRAVGREI